jgi:uncharacterized protein DUF6056
MKTPRIDRILLGVAACLLSVPLAAFAYMGTLSRAVTDDFCMPIVMDRWGIFGSIGWWYSNWSGRWAHFLAVNFAEAAGRWTIRATTGILVVALAAAAGWAAGEAARVAKIFHPGSAGFVVGGLGVLTAVAGAQDRFLSLYWRPAAIAYFLPIALLAVCLGLVARAIGAEESEPAGWRRWKVPLLGALLAAVAGGFYEIQTLLQMGIFGAAAGLTVVPWSVLAQPRIRRLVWPMLGASIAALLILNAAPGNRVRSANYYNAGNIFPSMISTPHVAADPSDFLKSRPLLPAIGRSLRAGGDFLVDGIRAAPLLALAVFLVALVLGLASSTGRSRRIAWDLVLLAGTVVTTWLLIAACHLPSLYLEGQTRARLMIVPRFALAAGIGTAGYLVGRLCRPIEMRAAFATTGAAIILLASGAGWLSATQSALEPASVARAYARGADARNRFLAAAPDGTDVVVPLLPARLRMWVGEDLSSKPGDFMNGCAAEFYGLRSVTAR